MRDDSLCKKRIVGPSICRIPVAPRRNHWRCLGKLDARCVLKFEGYVVLVLVFDAVRWASQTCCAGIFKTEYGWGKLKRLKRPCLDEGREHCFPVVSNAGR